MIGNGTIFYSEQQYYQRLLCLWQHTEIIAVAVAIHAVLHVDLRMVLRVEAVAAAVVGVLVAVVAEVEVEKLSKVNWMNKCTNSINGFE